MRKLLYFAAVLMLGMAAIPAHAQFNVVSRGPLSGNCPSRSLALDFINNVVYSCGDPVAGVPASWSRVGGGSSGAITGATAGGGLVQTLTTLGLNVGCATNQVLQWNGAAWVCATISGTVTGATSGGGLALTGSTLGLLTGCSTNQVLQWNGTLWNCATVTGVGTGTQFAVAYFSTTTALGSALGTISGQTLNAQNGAGPLFLSPGVPGGNGGSAVTTTPYQIKCDSSTTLLDRVKLVIFKAGSSVVTVPDPTSGCANNFVFAVLNDGAGTLTFNRTTTAVFNIANGATNSDGQTSFTLTSGQFATINSPDNATWTVRVTCAACGTGVLAITGDGHIITNSGSAGNVTLTISAVSGGIPYGTSSSAWAFSAVQKLNIPIIGGGAGQAPTSGFLATAGSGTTSDLACYTASGTIGNCSGPTFGYVVGVFTSSSTWTSIGEAVVNLDTSQIVTFNDYLCQSIFTPAAAHDNGSVPCGNGTPFVGLVKNTTGSTGSTATAFIELGAGLPSSVVPFTCGNSSNSTSVTDYCGVASLSATETNVEFTFPRAGVVSGLICTWPGSNTGIQTLTINFRQSAANSGMSCTLTAGQQLCSDNTHSVNVSTSAPVDISLVPSTTSTAPVSCAVNFQ